MAKLNQKGKYFSFRGNLVWYKYLMIIVDLVITQNPFINNTLLSLLSFSVKPVQKVQKNYLLTSNYFLKEIWIVSFLEAQLLCNKI